MKPPGRKSSRRAATIKTVADRAGVSIATVSRVLAGADGVGTAARRHVLKIIRDLDYYPNFVARGLRAGRRKVIGVIIPDLQNPFLTGVVHGVESVLHPAGYTLVLGHSNGAVEREREHMKVMRGEGAAGLILVPDNGSGTNYNLLGTWGIPAVAVDRLPKGLQVDLASTDHRKGAREAVEHLIEHGYKEIAIINGPKELSVARERLAGYQEALKAAGIALRESFIIHSDFRLDGGRTGMDQLLDLPQCPQAVFVGNNLMTLGVLQAVHQRGLRIPDEIAVVGFDDMPWASSLRPPLTVMAQPVEQLGKTAAQMLLERIDDPHLPVRQVILPPRLIVRVSCGVPAASSLTLKSQSGSAGIESSDRRRQTSTKTAIFP